MTAGRRLVVIAPHPDDETLGCGSLIVSAVRLGIPVGIIALTNGDASHPSSRRWPPAALGRLRSGEQRRALARLGAGDAKVRRLGWGDGRVAGDADGRRLSRALIALRAGVVLVTSDADHHPDHQAAARLARGAAGRLGLPLVIYAVWSRVDTVRRGFRRDRARKSWAMAAHRSQVAGYIADDPDGFRLSPAALASLIAGPEQFGI
ncbi:PIG-L family deacetylase [Sphingosinicellaceae bacterium]|nr:PIG-L family deacetylase [Sphingosinicellaceae bacterium]